MVIKDAKVYTEDFRFEERDIYVEDGKFAETASEKEVVYADDLYAIPGLIDIHLHGAVGKDFSDGDVKGIEKIAEYEAFHGITTIMPTTMSQKEKDLEKTIKAITAYKNTGDKADVAGIYLEGPFMSKERKGVHEEDNLRLPDIEMVHPLLTVTDT